MITEIPYQVNKTSLIEEIADLVRSKRVAGISDIRDESDRKGLSIVIELKRDANAEVILNQLYSHTRLEITFGMNLIAVVKGVPKSCSLKLMMQSFIDHRIEVITRRTQYDLRKAEEKSQT